MPHSAKIRELPRYFNHSQESLFIIQQFMNGLSITMMVMFLPLLYFHNFMIMPNETVAKNWSLMDH